MDKNTLSHYGWIVVLILILSVLLALATPFGKFIAKGFEATYVAFSLGDYDGMGNVIEDMGGGGDGEEDPTDPTEPQRGWIVPEGCRYSLMLNGSPTMYMEFEELPIGYEAQTGDIFENEDYTYYFNQIRDVSSGSLITNKNLNGWSVKAKTSKAEYGEIFESVNYKPVVSMHGAFYSTSVKVSPTIPSTVTDLSEAFASCNYLTNVVVPETVEDMTKTFSACFAFITTHDSNSNIVINANPAVYDNCFQFANIKNVNITGTSKILDELLNTW